VGESPSKYSSLEGLCWRRLHDEELHYFYSSKNFIRFIKSRRMRWEEHIARMGEIRNAYDIIF
jgi:hypothetical protein